MKRTHTVSRTRPRRRIFRFAPLFVKVASGLVLLAVAAAWEAHAEAQRAADAAALAGAAHLISDPEDSVGATDAALQYVERNDASEAFARLRPRDVSVDLDAGRVRVGVQASVIPFMAPRRGLSISAESLAEAQAASPPGARPLRPLKRLKLVDE